MDTPLDSTQRGEVLQHFIADILEIVAEYRVKYGLMNVDAIGVLELTKLALFKVEGEDDAEDS